MDRYSHTGLLSFWFEKLKIGANVQAILLRGKEKGAEFYLEINSFLTFVELNYTKVAISRCVCRFHELRMSDTGSPSEFYETQFLEGLYIAVRTRGVPIYKVFLLLILFVYSFLFYFILFCFAFIMPLIIVTYKGFLLTLEWEYLFWLVKEDI